MQPCEGSLLPTGTQQVSAGCADAWAQMGALLLGSHASSRQAAVVQTCMCMCMTVRNLRYVRHHANRCTRISTGRSCL